ncbi:MAG: 4Fe-4S binding protein, partial [Firmicutes bacterium]|nr:4Fe-4S binding protein [Bacillota bacterium]
MCERNCPSAAVSVTNFLAKVDYEKCTQCGVCTEKCPTKAIKNIDAKPAQVKEDAS